MRYGEINRYETQVHLDNEMLSDSLDPDLAQHPARVQPGSHMESVILDQIDQARYEEMAALDDTFEKRQRRAVRHWRRHL